MKEKIDLLDRKILSELDRDSRQTDTAIAHAVQKSKQLVGQRIKKLQSRKVISNTYTVIDPAKIGYTIHKNFLQLQNTDSNKESEIIEFLQQHDDIVWVAQCDGKFDLIFGTWARNMQQLDKTLTEVQTRFGEHIGERQISTIIKGEYFRRAYLVTQNKQERKESTFAAAAKENTLQQIDKKSCMQLQTTQEKLLWNLQTK